jgi:hypothetical protein
MPMVLSTHTTFGPGDYDPNPSDRRTPRRMVGYLRLPSSWCSQMRKHRKTIHRDILTPTEIGEQHQTQQHLQVRKDLQKIQAEKQEASLDLIPRYWNPKTKQYDIFATWDNQKKCWKRPDD